MKLGDLFGSKKEALGSGMARKGADDIDQRKSYTDYAIAQAEQGLPAVRFTDYVKGKR